MVVFLDQYDNEYGAQATLQVTNAVNGERSLKGTIVTNDDVLNTIEKGWKMQFDDEYYRIIYAEPVDLGNKKQVEFDAVHQFFYDFDKSSVHSQLANGSHTFETYLNFIFDGSGYTYRLEVDVKAFEKQSFGYKSRLSLFNDIITQAGVEFSVSGKVVRILKNVGTDLSTIVRKNFNMNDLKLKKNINDFITYQKGFGAWNDENDHSKGRLEVEYESPLTKEYGRIEGEPVVDERYKVAGNLKEVLKKNVENSYTVSVELTMEDLTKAGYKYQQPIAGDYIMAINEALGFRERIRIVSFTSEYDVTGKLLNHKVTCNDIGQVKKQSASYSNLSKQVSSNQSELSELAKIANRALVSADGKNTNYYGTTMPVDSPKGTLKKGDLLFLTVGDVTKQYVWNGAEWLINPIVNDIEAFKEQIANELVDVPDREEFEATITEKLATSKTELETQIDTAKTQAESNAKAYADEINQVTVEVAEQANKTAGTLKSELAKVQTDLTIVSNTANSAETSASEAKQQLTIVVGDLNTAKQGLQTQASQLQAQASAQSELTKRVSTVEETANGTKTTVSELSKTVGSNTANITSVTSRTKAVEDGLAGTKTTLTQVKTTVDGTSQKTATLETGLNGVKVDLAATTVTADTTKTNLANYQASNDKAVANLQSSLQTANGNISNLQTKVEAVPGQITSAVSVVEGKIPTNVSTRNLILKSNDLANPHKQTGANTTVTSIDDFFVIKSTGYTANVWGGMSWNMSISEVKAGEQFSILMPVYIGSSVDLDSDFCFELKRHNPNMRAYIYRIPKTQKDEWFNVAITFKITGDVVFDTYPFYVYLVKNGLVRIKPPMLVRGDLIPSDYQPAPEDYDSKLASAQSEIKQTTDAISVSVSTLDKSVVKANSLTINADGIVMKAGKSTTDVANAIGAYFAVNQNAINLFSDKINVKGSMIVGGAITSAKIASKSINTAHLNGKIITADVISSNAITADAIKAGAVTTDKMTANSINGDRIAAGTLDAAKIKAGSITASQIASGTITSNQIKAGGISAANIATGAITADKIVTGAINADKITSNAITSNHISTAGITANKIIGGTLTSTNNKTTLDLNTGVFKLTSTNSSITMNRGADNFLTLFNSAGITFKSDSNLLGNFTYSGHYSIKNNSDYISGLSLDVPNGYTFTISAPKATPLIEFDPAQNTFWVLPECIIDFGGGQTVAIEHSFGTHNDVDYSEFKAKGTSNQRLRFYADGRIAIE